ncbi:MAG: DUF4019 domain-containing protein [Candidatus Latescibacterota bacterium]
MKQGIALICGLLLASLAACGDRGEPGAGGSEEATGGTARAEEAAVDAAQAWLELVDSGNYGESWEEAAAYFRGAVAKEEHVHSLEAVRAPLGELVSRELATKGYHTALPGVPDGRYVVAQFRASFAGKQEALETVTAMLDSDEWRVAGYYIK